MAAPLERIARAPPADFDAVALGLDAAPASPLPRRVLHALLALVAAALVAVAWQHHFATSSRLSQRIRASLVSELCQKPEVAHLPQ